MQFCPEIAVLSSALQLAKIKIEEEEPLCTASKGRCLAYSNIITAAVDEICSGLQVPADPETMLAWQQKIHLLLLYTLIRNKYKTGDQQVPDGQVPILDSVHCLSTILPSFSCHLYFVLMKQCAWTQLFLQSLYSLDSRTSYQLLHDALDHIRSDPVTPEDRDFIAMVTETLLSQCFCLPAPVSSVTEQYLGSAMQPTTFITVMFSDQTEIDEGTVDIKPGNDLQSPKCVQEVFGSNVSNSPGSQFWIMYVKEDAAVVSLVTDYLESAVCQCEARGEPGVQCDTECRQLLGQLSLLFCLTEVLSLNAAVGKWLVHNLYPLHQETSGSNDFVTREDNFCLNYPLIEQLHCCISDHCIRELLKRLLNSSGLVECSPFKSDTDPSEIDQQEDELRCLTEDVPFIEAAAACLTTEAAVQKSQNSLVNLFSGLFQPGELVRMLPGLGLCQTVLLRMLGGTMCVSMSGTTPPMHQGSSSDGDDVDSSRHEPLLALGDDWTQDASLPALLWRIEHRLSHHAVCLDYLLSDCCPVTIWRHDSLYEVLNKQLSLLQQQPSVLSLVQKYRDNKHSPELRQLLLTAFTGLSPLEKDTVVCKLYVQGGVSIVNTAEDSVFQMTRVFNKITANMDSQVREDLYLLCFMRPRAVLCRAISTSIENEEQAANMPQVCELVPSLCRSWDTDDQTGSVLAVCLRSFLETATLTLKEQKHFTAFVSTLMMPSSPGSLSQATLLDSGEFLQTVVLPAICLYTDAPINIKFALNLLLACLEVRCNTSPHWTTFDPLALVLVLLELVHECVVVWEEKCVETAVEVATAETSSFDGDISAVAMETRYDRRIIREKSLQALDAVYRLIESEYLSTVDDVCVCWLLSVTESLHWSTRIHLCPLLAVSGHNQIVFDIMQELHDHVTNVKDSSLVPLLHLVSLGQASTTTLSIGPNIEQMTLEYSGIVTALTQMLPHLLYEECTRVMTYFEKLLQTEELDMVYRLHTAHFIPCLGLTDARVPLCLSQLLGDVIRTLLEILRPVVNHHDLVQHVLQTYVAVVKDYCTRSQKTVAMTLYVLAELFHHILEVAAQVPAVCLDTVLVLLLHVVRKFKEVTTEMNPKLYGRGQRLHGPRGVTDLRCGMLAGVGKLPVELEEIQMIRKLLC